VTQETTAPEGQKAEGLKGGAAVAVAMAIMNVATYGFTIVAARALGPQSYGAFAAVMNLLIVITVAQLALQATAARRISAAPGDVAVIERGVRRLTWQAAVVLGAAFLAAAPAVNLLLRLESLPTAYLVGLTAIPLTLQGGLAGTLQGERRWQALGVLYAAAGVPRLVVGTALILWRPEELIATLGVFLGALAPVAVGFWALRHRPDQEDPGASAGPAAAGGHEPEAMHRPGALLRESFRNSHALLGFFAVSNVDVILARNVLDGRDAGLYAAGLILTKAVLFLPQFVVVVAFPDMAEEESRTRALRLSLGLTGGLGVVAVLAAWVLSPVAMVFVGGAQYADVQGQLWVFAILGTLLAMIQLLVYALLARQGGKAIHLVWVGLVAMVVGAQLTDSIGALLVVVTTVDALLFVSLLVPVVLRGDRPGRAEPRTEPRATPAP